MRASGAGQPITFNSESKSAGIVLSRHSVVNSRQGIAMSHAVSKVKEEIAKIIPPTIFFLIMLHLVALERSLMLKGTGVTLLSSGAVTVAALVLGKAVLLADALPLVNRYPDKPLAHNVIWKTTIYVLVAFVVHYLENLYDFWKEAGSVVAANRELLAKIVWPHFWATQLLLVVIIFMYCTMRELVRVIGPDKVREMFFGPPPNARPSA
jgi:hypothetical protein